MAKVRKVSLRGYGSNSVQGAYRDRVEFDANGTLRSHVYPKGRQCSHLTGRLNEDERRQFLSDCHYGIAYLVVSYGTPIAWVDFEGDVYKVKQRFSVTTSKHMSVLY